MLNAVYKSAKLAIYEKHDAGEITESQRDELFAMLEAQKESSNLTPEKIKDFFDELAEKYPDNADDIEKLSKKLNKEEPEEDTGDDKGSDDSTDGEEVSESVRELMQMIENL